MSVTADTAGRGALIKGLRRNREASEPTNDPGKANNRERRNTPGRQLQKNGTGLLMDSLKPHNPTEIYAEVLEEPLSESCIAGNRPPSKDQGNATAVRPHQRGQGPAAWSVFFLHVIVCLTCTSGSEYKGVDEDECCADTLLNRQPSSSVEELTAESQEVDSASTIQGADLGPVTCRSAAVEAKSIQTKTVFRRFFPLKNCSREAKLPPGPLANSVQFSLRKRMFCKQKQRPKKPSPFLKERIGGSQEYIEEENIVLANKHIGGVAINMMNPAPYHHDAIKHPCPDMLTISVDLSAFALC